ncbi:MAG: hypothetical protein V3U43_03560, partial [Pseudomonadales bacterium]
MASRGSHEAPVVDGKGELVDYAVRMHQFDPERQLDVELEAGRLGLEDMDELARTVAAIHAAAPRTETDSPWGEFDHLMGPVDANFAP